MTLDAVIAEIMERAEYGAGEELSGAKAALVLDLLNNHIAEVCRKASWDWLTEPFDLAVTAGQQDYTLPSTVIQLLAVPAAGGGLLKEISLKEYVDWQNGLGGDVSGSFVFIGRASGARKIRLVDSPSESATLECWGKLRVPRFATTDFGTSKTFSPMPDDAVDVVSRFVEADLYKKTKATLAPITLQQANSALASLISEQSSPAATPRIPPPDYMRLKRAQRRGYAR